MQLYKAPNADIKFNLEAFDYEGQVASIDEYADFDLDMAMSLLDEHARFCENELLPLNESGDRKGIHFNPDDASVTLPEGFKEAFNGYKEAGFLGLPFPPEHGGTGAPLTLAAVASEVLIATNKAFSMCPGLTSGLIEALEAHGSDDLKGRYLENLITGKWSGTMCLTEPQCGTDLGMLTTKAIPEGDHYRLTGSKIWITFGEHDLTENIVHLVLARLPDAPPGIKGISVFIVPKVREDGTANGVSCGGLEHKMGIHASPTCVINLDNAVGYLVGVPHKGMRAMFTMMNNARLNVGVEGLALSDAAYQHALAYAKDRRQSRSLDPAKRELDHAADNILVHPDVRRMLLNVKSTNEALRGLVTYIAINIDRAHHCADEADRQKSDDIVALLTPIIKSYATERGFENVSECMQVMGGAGYTQDWPVEQYLRDVRIALIYEGTNHIQALDLVGRKLPRHGGRLLQTFMGEVTTLIRGSKDTPELAPFISALKERSKQLQAATMELAGKGMSDQEEAGAAASNYLNLFALTTLAYIWCRQLTHALSVGGAQQEAKFQTARYFFDMVLPEADLYARLASVGKAPMMDFNVDYL
ncbi:MAG: acyl-CoA dehydrogenase [Deltaproteobacteria bacterium]|nr:acyl-CoA dehydrogenase [Deltaproteobacteria bacterium]